MGIHPDIIEMASVMIIPIMAMGLYGLLRLGRSPIGTALARRIEGGGDDRAAELEDRLHGLEVQLLETQERLDFTERLLSQAKESNQDGAPKQWEDTPGDGITTPIRG